MQHISIANLSFLHATTSQAAGSGSTKRSNPSQSTQGMGPMDRYFQPKVPKTAEAPQPQPLQQQQQQSWQQQQHQKWQEQQRRQHAGVAMVW